MEENDSTLSSPKPETGIQKTLRGAWRWLLVGLVAFAAGALIIVFALYMPVRQKLDTANADLEAANATIASNNDQISSLQADNEALQMNLDIATQHLNVLEALSGMRGASLAVDANDYAGAQLSLIKAAEALDALSGQLGAEQKDVLTAMQQSAAQALTEVQSNLNSAQPKLEQLINNLVQLEISLFSSP